MQQLENHLQVLDVISTYFLNKVDKELFIAFWNEWGALVSPKDITMNL
jgi:hypothetical protein